MLESGVLEKNQTTVADSKATTKGTRAFGLDALRGIAILGMVFSGVFPHEEPWPAWLFHAQVGPPNFNYTPEIPGITWVDLVFPFFLFSMGAAFPLALKRKIKADKRTAIFDVLKRGLLLVAFAIILRHTNPGFLKGDLWLNYLTGLTVFLSFFLVFMPFKLNKGRVYALRLVGFSLIAWLIALHHQYTPLTFDLYRQDIIILVLANMAVFGALIWVITRKNLMLRFGILALFAGIWLTKEYTGSYAEVIYQFHPSLAWIYRFEFLKYLNVVLPATVLGEMLIRHNDEHYKRFISSDKIYLLVIALAILCVNLYGLFTRQLMLTYIADVLLCMAGARVVSNFTSGKEVLLKKLFHWGIFWLFLGLTFEPMNGGIKKDPSSFSFWFLTTGLAFFTYIVCEIIAAYRSNNVVWKSIVSTGQNPMVAYVAASFVILPVLYFLGLTEIFNYLKESNVYFGIVKAIVVTLGVVCLTSYTSRRKWFWKT